MNLRLQPSSSAPAYRNRTGALQTCQCFKLPRTRVRPTLFVRFESETIAIQWRAAMVPQSLVGTSYRAVRKRSIHASDILKGFLYGLGASATAEPKAVGNWQ
jgi:hypothetical protein